MNVLKFTGFETTIIGMFQLGAMVKTCGSTMWFILTLLIVTGHIGSVTSPRPCGLSGHRARRGPCDKSDCRSRGLQRIPRHFANDVTELDLSRNKILNVRANDFVNARNLRVLDLSCNAISTLENRCFRHLQHLERLDLNDNNISSLTPEVFVGLGSLRVLTMSGLPLTSYPTQFATHTPMLRVLSLSAIGDATIPAEYAQLEVLDFYKDCAELTKITAAMFDDIRDSNITTLSFRSVSNLKGIAAGAFSNLPNIQSLLFACNNKLPFRGTVTSLAATRNTSINAVVLDGSRGDDSASFNESDFCSPFWRQVTRLSVKRTNLISLVFQYTGCLSHLRSLSLGHNAPQYFTPKMPDCSRVFPNIRTLSVTHRAWLSREFDEMFCDEKKLLFDVDRYFPANPPIAPMPKEEPINATDQCSAHTFTFGFINIPSPAEFIHMNQAGIQHPREFMGNICVSSMHLRYLNMSNNQFATSLCRNCRIVGVSRLDTVDFSHGGLEFISPQFFQHFKYLRNLNLSHNSLGVSKSDFHEEFRHLIRLEDINLSDNQLERISPHAFERSPRLKWLNLANNKLIQIDMNFTHMAALEYVDLSGNSLVQLCMHFTARLDKQFGVRPFEMNLRGVSYACNCDSLPFVRWIQVTSVNLTERNQLTCSYEGHDDVRMIAVSLDELEAGCDVDLLPIIACVGVGILVVLTGAAALVRYHRWYIKYHLILCCMRQDWTEYRHDAMVLYFIHAASPEDQQGGAARISRWVSRKLMEHAESSWGLRLYVGDRDDLGGASKMHNFVRGFQSSDKVVVCLTREFIDDSDCMNYLATALDSSKPLSKFIFVLFDDVEAKSVPRRLRQLLLPDSPAACVTWGDIKDDHQHTHHAFWRRMRNALMRDDDREGCLGRTNVTYDSAADTKYDSPTGTAIEMQYMST